MAVDFVTALGVMGTLFGAGGLVVGVYSYLKQRRMEKQLDRKEDLRAVADDLEKLRDALTGLFDNVKRPRSHEDFDLEMRDLVRDILAYEHGTGNVPTVSISELQIRREDRRDQINNANEAINTLSSSSVTPPILKASLPQSEVDLNLSRTYYVGQSVQYFPFVFGFLKGFDQNEESVLSEFDPDVLDDVEDITTRILTKMMSNLFDRWEGNQFHPDEFDTTKEMGDAIFRYFIYYEGIETDLNELEQILERLEDLRTDLLQTSYS